MQTGAHFEDEDGKDDDGDESLLEYIFSLERVYQDANEAESEGFPRDMGLIIAN